MPKVRNREYYEFRARSEIRKANMTTDSVEKRMHLALAAQYAQQARLMGDGGPGSKAAKAGSLRILEDDTADQFSAHLPD
jgi:hypothetical protein